MKFSLFSSCVAKIVIFNVSSASGADEVRAGGTELGVFCGGQVGRRPALQSQTAPVTATGVFCAREVEPAFGICLNESNEELVFLLNTGTGENKFKLLLLAISL